MKPKLSLIIVHYHNQKILFNCLNSIKDNPPQVEYEVIVIDNDEQKTIGSKLKPLFPQVKYVASPGNIGYGAGNNLGASAAEGEYLFILNPDTLVLKGCIDKLISFIESSQKIGVVAPTLLNKNLKPYPLQGSKELTPIRGVFALSFLNKLFPNNPISKAYWLKDADRSQPLAVDVIPGSAFLIRKKLFDQVNGFDENMFLYFEESDLCLRLKQLGFKLMLLPQARLVHCWAGSTPKSPRIKQIFASSRFYYFNKHYGLIPALMVELMARLSLEVLGLSLILLLATWLRFYRLPELMTFISDQGRDYLAAKDMLLTGQPALVGIPSSVPWLHQGPVFIWLIALALKLGRFHPIAPAVLTAVFGVLTVYLAFVLAKKWFNHSTGLIAALIAAASPLMVVHSRLAYHTSPIPLFTLLYLLALTSQSVGWSFFLAGLLLQFELTTLPLALLAALYLFKKKQKLFPLSLVFIIPFIPKLIFDLTHGFKQTLGLIAWAGYRFVSFFGFSGRHTVSPESLIQVSQTIFNYWQKFVCWDQPIIAAGLGLLALIGVFKNKNRLLAYFLLINLAGFYLHGAPSEAYFPVLFPVWALLLAWLVNRLKQPALILGLLILVAYNLAYLIRNDFIPYGPTLSQRLTLARLIKIQSPSEPFKLEGKNLDNYRYLLWWLGEPESPEAKSAYMIYEGGDQDFVAPIGATVYHLPHQKLIKYD